MAANLPLKYVPRVLKKDFTLPDGVRYVVAKRPLEISNMSKHFIFGPASDIFDCLEQVGSSGLAIYEITAVSTRHLYNWSNVDSPHGAWVQTQ